MTKLRFLLVRPQRRIRVATIAVSILLVLAVSWLHLQAGLAYEFHLFFGLPIIVVAWSLGARAGIAMAAFVVALWLAADLRLGGSQADILPLAFNSAIRLSIFVVSATLLARLYRLLASESRLAREDGLTGLANRREFIEQGAHALALANREQIPVTAVFIDLDFFKEVNDHLGHEAGDAVLVAVAATLRGYLRASDIGGRLGGDEFALILPGMNAANARPYVERLRRDLLAAMVVRDWPVRFSIGVASYVRPPSDVSVLIAAADALMYEVKRAGRDATLQREFTGCERCSQ